MIDYIEEMMEEGSIMESKYKNKMQDAMIELNNFLYEEGAKNPLSKDISEAIEKIISNKGFMKITGIFKLMDAISFSGFKRDDNSNPMANFIYMCYLRTIDTFLSSLDIGFDFSQINNTSQLAIDDSETGKIIELTSNIEFLDFCKDPTGKLNDFIYGKIIETIEENIGKIKEYNYKPVWNDYLYSSIEYFIAEKPFKDLYEKYNLSPILPTIGKNKAIRNHIDNSIKKLDSNIFNEENLKLSNYYCAVPAEYLSISKSDNRLLYRGNSNDSVIDTWIHNQEHGVLIVKGEPGSGKSTVLKNECLNLLKHNELVFFLDIKDINKINGKYTQESVIRSLINKFDVIDSITKNMPFLSLKKVYGMEKAIFVFDGLDEVANENEREVIESFLEAASELGVDFRVIISGRSHLFQYYDDNTYYRQSFILGIQNLDRNYAEKIIEKYAALLDCPCTYNEIESLDPEFVTSPLLLFLIMWVKKNNASEFSEIKNKATLYELILKTMYYRNYKDQQNYSNNVVDLYIDNNDESENSYANFKRSLQIIGFVAYINNKRNVPLDLCQEYANKIGFFPYNYWMREETQNKSKPYRLILQFFSSVKESSVYFVHKTFYEYLAEAELLDILSTYAIAEKEDKDFLFHLMFVLLSPHEIEIPLKEESYLNEKFLFFKNLPLSIYLQDIIKNLSYESQQNLAYSISDLFYDIFIGEIPIPMSLEADSQVFKEKIDFANIIDFTFQTKRFISNMLLFLNLIRCNYPFYSGKFDFDMTRYENSVGFVDIDYLLLYKLSFIFESERIRCNSMHIDSVLFSKSKLVIVLDKPVIETPFFGFIKTTSFQSCQLDIQFPLVQFESCMLISSSINYKGNLLLFNKSTISSKLSSTFVSNYTVIKYSTIQTNANTKFFCNSIVIKYAEICATKIDVIEDKLYEDNEIDNKIHMSTIQDNCLLTINHEEFQFHDSIVKDSTIIINGNCITLESTDVISCLLSIKCSKLIIKNCRISDCKLFDFTFDDLEIEDSIIDDVEISYLDKDNKESEFEFTDRVTNRKVYNNINSYRIYELIDKLKEAET